MVLARLLVRILPIIAQACFPLSVMFMFFDSVFVVPRQAEDLSRVQESQHRQQKLGGREDIGEQVSQVKVLLLWVKQLVCHTPTHLFVTLKQTNLT